MCGGYRFRSCPNSGMGTGEAGTFFTKATRRSKLEVQSWLSRRIARPRLGRSRQSGVDADRASAADPQAEGARRLKTELLAAPQPSPRR